jgi:hypothetical protein
LTTATHDRERLKRILDLSDRLGTLRRRVREGGPGLSPRDLTQEIRSIAGSVVSIGLPGTLGRLEKEFHLGPQEVMVLLILLNRRIEPGDSSLAGREILATLFPSTFGILSGASLLSAEAPLRTSGSIEETEEDDDLLECRFGLSDRIFRSIEEDVNPRVRGTRAPRPYRNHFEHLADLARLTSLMLRRSMARFDTDPYGNRIFEEQETPGYLDRRAYSALRRVRERVDATPEAEKFPLLALSKRLRLSEDEQMILVVLLVQECYFGNPGLEAVECLKMVSRTPEQLLRKRDLISSRGRLRTNGLVELEDPVDEKEVTAELVLPNWVSALLLGEGDGGVRGPIGPDTRIEFHQYLKRLEDSDRFFRDLEG